MYSTMTAFATLQSGYTHYNIINKKNNYINNKKESKQDILNNMASVTTEDKVPTEEERKAMKAKKLAEDDEKIYKASNYGASRLDKNSYVVWDDDASLGKTAPSLENLVWKKGDKYNYGDKPITVVGFWAKFAKGDYATLNSWSHLQRKYADKGVQFVGVSRDRKEGDVDKFVGRLGTFMRELGERGITLNAEFPLAFDPETQVGETFRTLSQLMSLAVGMCYVVNAEGVIQWREQFSRGGTCLNQLEKQLDLLIAGKPVELVNGNEPEEDEADDVDETGKTTNVKIAAPGAAEDY